VHYESVRVCDAYMITYHINFTAKMKGTEDFDYGRELFFAEVTCDCKAGEHKLVVSCFCKVKPTDNGIIHSLPCLFAHGSSDLLSSSLCMFSRDLCTIVLNICIIHSLQ
jgi:hypothetical protein